MGPASFGRQLGQAIHNWWREHRRQSSLLATGLLFAGEVWGFLRDSTPERRRQRYGDMDYDWDHRVNTTGGSVRWRERLLGTFLSAYQPTEPAAFREMMAALPIDFHEFTFVDLGSGKGRTLLMASEYPFRKIVGVEILPALHQVAQENLSRYKSESQKCFAMEAVCADATEFPFPDGPMVLYLFHPLPETALRRVLARLDQSLRDRPRAVYVLYHNPLLERVLSESAVLSRIGGTPQYSVYAFTGSAGSRGADDWGRK